MADTNLPSDDVLSSIRRLVVDEPRIGSAASVTLKLTPNLRIVRPVARPKPADALHRLLLQPATGFGMAIEPKAEVATQPTDAVATDWTAENDTTAPEARASVGADCAKDLSQQADLAELALRDVVRDLIREQFQGDLGLRITRSIRKLVKAEIAREMDLRKSH
jgi:hypothetical protein